MNKCFAMIVFSLALTGCVTTSPQFQEKLRAGTPICYGDFDCKAKWLAARDWVQKNSAYKVQIYSDDLIETYNSRSGDPGISARVSKELLRKNVDGEYVYAISAKIFCGNIFGCVPNSDAAIAAFNDEVSRVEAVNPDCYRNLLKKDGGPKIGASFENFNNYKIVVKRVCNGSPASQGGLAPNDILKSINGINVDGLENVSAILKNAVFGEKINFEVLRNDQYRNLEIKLLTKDEHYEVIKGAQKSKEDGGQTTKNSSDIEKKLESLSRMFEKGLITKKEYESKKRDLLNSI